MKKIIYLLPFLMSSSMVLARGGGAVPEIDGALVPQVITLAVGIALLLKKK
jgi:hypothetical protein